MMRTRQSRTGAMISLLGCLMVSTAVLAQTGGASGAVNGGAGPSPGSEAGVAVGMPVIRGTTESAAPPVNRTGTYGGMGATSGRPPTVTNPNCTVSGPNCYNLDTFPQEMPSPPPQPHR
ncbi:MAG TPA: hypothetical protein VMD53_07385 [Rhizomicrobium sp.]|nr:hypothetical protein [Rhizomicrobium sp.]